MIYPRSVIEECGWFDENFGSSYAAYEDADYSFRVTKYGYRLLVDPNLKVGPFKLQDKAFSFIQSHIRFSHKQRVFFL